MQTRNSEWKVQYDSLLEQGTKPGRYIGGEPNMIRKELEQVRLRFALAFPDVYEIGMSHNGIRMLYHILNRMDDVYAERVFAPWVDMGGIFRSANLPLLSLETKTPIRDFDLVGFSLQAEQTYTNVLYMLDLAGIPLLADQRGDDHPLVCAGGPCTANPEPLADFIDFFVIGDAEETIVEIIECCREVVENGLKRWETLEALAKIQGVYVPQIQQPPKPWQAETRPGKPVTMVKRRWIDALSPDHISTSPIVPVIDIVQDRVSVEVMRGCTQGCRFCQAGYWYRPTRELDVDDIVRVTAESLRNTGNREIGLLSLSTADYSQIECLTKGMARQFSKDKVSISLPSLRADMFSVSLAENVGEVRKNGFTFAPEAGSVRMRKFINKNISNEELFQAIETAYRQGWNLIKLYFMIGLPTETDADIRELVDLIRQVGKIGKQFKGRKNVNASIGVFVPKSFTPFQWDGYESLAVITERLNYLKSAVRFPFARLKWHDPKEGFIEGVLSRGDRQVGRALLKAYSLGCHFDGWDEMFRFDLWMKAFEEAQIDPHFYNRTIGLQEVLPWDFIDIGVSKKFLLKERERSYREVQTYDCKWGDCRGCGIPGNYADIKLAEDPFAKATETLVQIEEVDAPVPISELKGRVASGVIDRLEEGSGMDDKVAGKFSAKTDLGAHEIPQPYILHYWKEGDARFLSHLNVMGLIEKAMIRSGFQLRFTEGFNPHPKFTTSPATPLGMRSRSEYVLFENHGELPTDAVEHMNRFLIEGLTVQSIQPMDKGRKGAITQPLQVTYRASYPTLPVNGDGPGLSELKGRMDDLINHLIDHQKGNDFWCNSKEHEQILHLGVEKDVPLEFVFTVTGHPETGALLKPRDFIEQSLNCPPDLSRKFSLSKESMSF